MAVASAGRAEPIIDVLTLAAPADGATNVPTNAAIIHRYSVFQSPLPTEPPVVVADDVAVAVTLVRVEATTPGEGFLVVKPTAGLWPPGATIVVSGTFPFRGVNFSTGTEPSDELVVPSVAQVSSSGFLTLYFGTLEGGFGVNVVSTPDVGELLLHDFGVVGGVSAADGFTGAGPSVSSVTGEWPGAFFDGTAQVRFAAMGLDGSPGRWGDPVTLTLPGDRDCDGVGDPGDACPDQPGVSAQFADGCPVNGAANADFRCDDGVFCHTFADPPPTDIPACAVQNGDDDGEDDADGPSSDGCAATPLPAALFLAFLARRRRPR